MALFFRKRIKILPGVTLNLSKSGVSATVGRKGASVSVGKRGTYLNAGLPGTGIYSRTRLDKPAGRRRPDLSRRSGPLHDERPLRLQDRA